MWKLLPRLGLFKVVFLAYTIVFLALGASAINESADANATFTELVSRITPSTLLFMAVTYGMGKYGWRLFWRAPILGRLLNSHVCPDLNGTWVGAVCWNEGNVANSKEVRIEIEADMFGYRLAMDTLDGYSRSAVTVCEIHKIAQTGQFVLSYIFEASVPFPKETDAPRFAGAANLDILLSERGVSLDGTYWTNRAWQVGSQTVGRIMLQRKE